jgi:hypothetical protein
MVCRVANFLKSTGKTERTAAPLAPLVPSPLLLTGSAIFLACSAFLVYTLVIEEDYVVDELATLMEDIAIIGIPAIIGLVLAAIVVNRARKP